MAISTFAQETGAFVIAQGIEDQETLEFLQLGDRALHGETIIQGGQGYGLGRPQATVDPAVRSEPSDMRNAA